MKTSTLILLAGGAYLLLSGKVGGFGSGGGSQAPAPAPTPAPATTPWWQTAIGGAVSIVNTGFQTNWGSLTGGSSG